MKQFSLKPFLSVFCGVVLILVSTVAFSAELRQIRPTTRTIQPAETTVQATIKAFTPNNPVLTAGGSAVDVTVSGTNLNLITSVQILLNSKIVSNVAAQLGVAAPTSRQVTLTAQSGASAGKYQVRLLAGGKAIDLNTKVVSVIVSPPVQTPSSEVIAGKTAQGTSPARDMESKAVLAERSGVVTDRLVRKLPDSRPSGTVMIDTVPLPEKPASGLPGSRLPDSNKVNTLKIDTVPLPEKPASALPGTRVPHANKVDTLKIDTVPLPEKPISGLKRTAPQTTTTEEREGAKMQPLRAPMPPTDTSGAKILATKRTSPGMKYVERKDGLKPQSGFSDRISPRQGSSTLSDRIGSAQLAESKQLSSSVVPVNKENWPDLSITECEFSGGSVESGVYTFQKSSVGYINTRMYNTGKGAASFPVGSATYAGIPPDSPRTNYDHNHYADVGGLYLPSEQYISLTAGQVSITYWQLEPGDYTYKFIADPDNIVLERSEDNNIRECKFRVADSTTQYPPADNLPPDLEIINLKISPSEGLPTDTYRMSGAVRNQGEGYAVLSGYTISQGKILSCGKFYLGRFDKSIVKLESSEDLPVDINKSLTNLVPGQHTFECKVDYQNEIAESNEDNNTATATVLITLAQTRKSTLLGESTRIYQAQLADLKQLSSSVVSVNKENWPDLSITECEFSGGSVESGVYTFQKSSVGYINTRMYNTGKGAASFPVGSATYAGIPPDSPRTNYDHNHYADVGGLYLPSEQYISLTAGQVSITYWQLEPGDYTYKFIADPDNIVLERSEDNNIRECKFRVIDSSSTDSQYPPADNLPPDLEIINLKISPSEGLPTDTYRMSGAVRNQGEGYAVLSGYTISQGKILSCGKFYLGRFDKSIVKLESSEDLPVDINKSLTNLVPGQHTFECKVDYQNEIAESNEDNNTATATVLIRE